MFHLSGALFGPVPLGTVFAGGGLNVPITVPDLPPGVLGAEVWLQAVLAGPSGGTLSSWVHLTVLDSTL